MPAAASVMPLPKLLILSGRRAEKLNELRSAFTDILPGDLNSTEYQDFMEDHIY